MNTRTRRRQRQRRDGEVCDALIAAAAAVETLVVVDAERRFGEVLTALSAALSEQRPHKSTTMEWKSRLPLELVVVWGRLMHKYRAILDRRLSLNEIRRMEQDVQCAAARWRELARKYALRDAT